MQKHNVVVLEPVHRKLKISAEQSTSCPVHATVWVRSIHAATNAGTTNLRRTQIWI